jgi:thymidylate synthase (FAD)
MFTEAKVYLTGQLVLSEDTIAQFLQDEKTTWDRTCLDDNSTNVEIGGRLCYFSFANPRPGGNKGYISHIHEVKHGSVLEHTAYTFILTQVSRSLTHELVRHRVGMAYSQLSQRYSDKLAFVCPPALKDDYERYLKGYDVPYMKKLMFALDAIQDAYREMNQEIEGSRKEVRQAARCILPNMTETKIQVTANARALLHFFNLRGSKAADVEIRALAIKMYHEVIRVSPNIFGCVKYDGETLQCDH